MSVSLRAMRTADVAWVESWLDPALSDAGAHDDADRVGRTRMIIERERERVGALSWRQLDASTAIIEFVAITDAASRRGYGMKATALLEDVVRKRGVRSLLAPATEQRGIAVYFWIRLGYRPLPRGEWPCAQDGVAWLRRDLAVQKKGSQSRMASKTS